MTIRGKTCGTSRLRWVDGKAEQAGERKVSASPVGHRSWAHHHRSKENAGELGPMPQLSFPGCCTEGSWTEADASVSQPKMSL